MANAEQEPTMEEILASIRRIINEDDEPQAGAAAAAEPAAPAPEPEPVFEAAPEPEPEPEPASDEINIEDDVLELTDRVEEETEGTSPMAIADDLMIVDREDETTAEPEPEPEPEPVMAQTPQPAAPAPAQDEDSLLAEPAASAAAGAFAALTENLRVSSENGQTLEGIVRELMRPMLKQWLDENLPSIVEAKVQEEIERVARRRR
ncbi:MAG: DUF2497 domain-containing protein [Caulobacterales bacterium]|uniref:DUF2497 domain-containing protein n=1 Tax=Glycocaulis sp. TaxID=1969725 RepID=UPI003F9FAC68